MGESTGLGMMFSGKLARRPLDARAAVSSGARNCLARCDGDRERPGRTGTGTLPRMPVLET